MTETTTAPPRTEITDRWGATHYGRLNGLMTAPIVIVMALAPWAGSALSVWTGSYARAYLVLGAVALLAAVFAAASMPAEPRNPHICLTAGTRSIHLIRRRVRPMRGWFV